MTFGDYQELSRRTAIYPSDQRFIYPVLGLCGEAGEAIEKVKKAVRDDGGLLTPRRRKELLAEIGDVLWYLSQLATELDQELEWIVEGSPAPDGVDELSRAAMRLAAGTGRIAKQVDVATRDGQAPAGAELVVAMRRVAGCLHLLCSLMDTELIDVAEANIKKLSSRHDRGVIQGSGDFR